MEKLIESKLDWDRVITRRGNTQEAERYYVGVIVDVITSLGGVINKTAGSQQPVDIQNVTWPNGTVDSYECKKANSGARFILNDTFVKRGIKYIFLYGKTQKVKILAYEDIVNASCPNELSNEKNQLKKIANVVLDMLNDNITSENIKKLFSEVICFTRLCVINNIISIYDIGELFKTNIKFGNVNLRPRPNFSIHMPYKSLLSDPVEPHFPTV